MKKFFAFLLVVVLMLSLSVAAFAQTVGTAADGTGSITINNAAKGETYAIYKLFDATVSTFVDSEGNTKTAISYRLPAGMTAIPAGLTDYFEKDAAGNITAKIDELNDDAIAALTAWASTATAVASAESNGTTLTFQGLAYGYYVVTTTQGNAAISVDSTAPNASIYDKNSTITIKDPAKTVEHIDYFIGETITYTVSFGTANYHGEGAEAKKILSYVISDTLPDFLSDVEVTSITIGGAAYTTDAGKVPQFDANKTITIPWVDGDGVFLYDNGAQIVITYTAVLTSKATIDGNGNTNEVTITFTEEGGGKPDSETVDSTVYTYAIALMKVDDKGKALPGAVFDFENAYVLPTPDSDGAYIYVDKDEGDGTDGRINRLTTPENGLIIIKGIKYGTSVNITEFQAPNGYNKLSDPISITPVKTGATTTSVTTYFDENGNKVDQEVQEGFTVIVSIDEISATPVVVVNKAGTELPSTGGIGTTIFYVLGGILAVGAAVVLIARKRVSE